MSAELIEYLRAHVRYEGMPATARAAMEEAADALASKEEEILALADALHNAVHALVLNIGPDDDAAQAGIAVLARHDPRKPLQALQGDADA